MPTQSNYDFYNQAVQGGSVAAPSPALGTPVPQEPQEPTQSNYDFYNQAVSGITPKNQFLSHTGSYIDHDESDRFTEEHPDDNWLEKSWSFLNKPLTETLFGWGQYRSGAGGFERGVEKIASGLTTPLSLGLLAAFAPAGFVEGVAGSALKEGLTEGGTLLGETALDGITAAGKVENYAKAVAAAKKAQVAGTGIQDAVSTATNGAMSEQEFLNFGQYLRNQGMQETDILPESFARRIASQGLRKAGVSDENAIQVARSAETLVNLGFGVQQLHGAIYAYPRAMDLMAHGDTDGAAEYLTEAAAGTVFGVLGIAGALHGGQEIFHGLNTKGDLALSDATENFLKLRGIYDQADQTRQSQIGADKNLAHAGMMDIAGLKVPASLKKGSWADVSLGDEFASAFNQIVTSKADREKLLDTQKTFLVAMETGVDATHAHQSAVALARATGQEDYLTKVLGHRFVQPLRTVDDIEKEEVNDGLSAKASARAGRQTVDSLGIEIQTQENALKLTKTPEEADAVRQQIQALTSQRDEAQLAQVKLDEQERIARLWEPPKKVSPEAQAVRTRIALIDAALDPKATKKEGAATTTPEEAVALHARNTKLIQERVNLMHKLPELEDKEEQLAETPEEKEERLETAFNERYKFLNSELNKAVKGLDPTGPNALDQFNEKIRALGNHYADTQLIEQKYPHFKTWENNFDPSAIYREDGGPFYLKSAQVIQDKIKGKTPGRQILNTLKNAGVKGDELFWTGLDKLLDSDKPFTLQELKDHLAQNNLNVEEVSKGLPVSPVPPKISWDEAKAAHAKGEPVYWTLKDDPYGPMHLGDNFFDEDSLKNDLLGESIRNSDFYRGDADTAPRTQEPVKFSKYTLAGGTNQRELLITRQYKDSPRLEELREKGPGRYGDPSRPYRLTSGRSVSEEAEYNDLIEQARTKEEKTPHFLGIHWEEPDVLAHVRVNDRTTPDGKRLLHIEELQSDWHQQGRDRGYTNHENAEALASARQAYRSAENSNQIAFLELKKWTTREQREEAFKNDFGNTRATQGFSPEAVKAFDDYVASSRRMDVAREKAEALAQATNENGVPNAPFKKTWHELLMKRMLHFAAEHGYDGVSWTPGEEQIKRYPGLAEVADELHYNPQNKTLYVLRGNQYTRVIPNLSPEQLVPYVGKEVANRLLNSPLEPHQNEQEGSWTPPIHRVKGDDLKLGGEGMRGFYDKIVPDYMNSIGKRFGAKVDRTTLGEKPATFTPEDHQVFKTYEDLSKKLALANDAISDWYNEQGHKSQEDRDKNWEDTYNKLLDKQEEANRAKNTFVRENHEVINKRLDALDKPKSHDVQYLPINKDMRESVLGEGFSLFNKIHDTAPTKEELDSVQKQIESEMAKISSATDETRPSIDKRISGLLKKLKRMQGLDLGEVHRLPDGKRVAYLNSEALHNIDLLLNPGKRRSGTLRGTVLTTERVGYLRRRLKASSHPQWYEDRLNGIIDNSLNSNGEMVIAQADPVRNVQFRVGDQVVSTTRKDTIRERLHTLREELTHSWQLSLENRWRDHLPSRVVNSLHSVIPDGMLAYLKKNGYGDYPPHMKVLEAAAKMMVDDPSVYNITDEEASTFLNKYFEAVKAEHGAQAFDTLTHITNQARHWKEDFLNATNDTEPRPTEGNVGGVGEGPQGGNPPGPPEPPYHPEWDNDPDEPEWRKKFPPSTINGATTSAFPPVPWLDGPLHRGIDPRTIEEVEKARGKVRTPEQIEYVRSMLRAYDRVSKGLTPKEMEFYKKLRRADDNNWGDGYSNGIIHSIVDNHITHIWKPDPKKGTEAQQHAQSGSFSINATQARHRSWSLLDGLLQGRELATHDPVAIIANGASQISTAIARRRLVEAIQASGLRDPEGMPITAFLGMGRVVPGEDGTSSSVLVNPNVVKNIIMRPDEWNNLKSVGLLDTYLRDGRVVDRTPQVGQGNVKEWILSVQKQLEKLQEQNPLLLPGAGRSSPQNREWHEAGWRDTKKFAQGQAQKIAEYLSDALERIRSKPPIDAKGNFAPVSIADKPKDFEMGKSYSDILHGVYNRITPSQMDRLEKYLEIVQNHAGGASSDGTRSIRPVEIARLLLQNQEHIDPTLKGYLDQHHDLFGTDHQGNVAHGVDGGWAAKPLLVALHHIAHAATNEAYPRLSKDLLDLKYVDDNLTSANPLTQEMHKKEAEQRLKDINERQPKQYLWAPKNHIAIDHPAFKGFKWMASAPDGTPTLSESDMTISRHYYKFFMNALGLKPSWLREPEGIGKVTSAILKGGAQAKSAILSGSPFHVIQIALRALMLHVNPFVRPNPIRDLDERFEYAPGKYSTLGAGVRNSLKLFDPEHAAEDMSVGVASHGGLIEKIPIYGPFTDQIHDLLFNRLIPSVKADAYKKMYSQYADAHPDWTEDAIAYHTAQHTNNAFGGVNWREMGRSATTQDWFNLVALAPDWLESEMRFAAGLFNGYGVGPGKYNRDSGKNFTRIQVGQAAVVLWTAARLANQLYSGNPRYDSPFGFVVKDEDGRDIEYSVRTMPTDILHAATDPMGFLAGRASPFARTAAETISGRNAYGQKLTDSEKYVDLVSNLVPIWGQAGLKKVTHLATSADVGNVQQAVKAAGATANVLRSPAQKTAANLASERSEDGQMNPAKIQRHRLLLQLEDNLRNGQIKNSDIQLMVDQGNLPETDAKTIIKNVKETAGEDPEMARMYSRVTRLDYEGALAVWDDSNPEERDVLHDLIVKKSKSYIKKSLKDETPSTRAVDPYYKRARRFAPIVQEETQQ